MCREALLLRLGRDSNHKAEWHDAEMPER
jgi:hypothetical protein